MAGKLLTLDEAAQRLGISVEEVNRLVDRKQLFAVRDGNTLKFKHDEVERVAASEGGSMASGGSGLSLDLELDAPQGGASAGASGNKASGSLDLLGDSLKLDAGDSANATGSGPPVSASANAVGGSLSLDDGLVLGDEVVVADSLVVPGADRETPPEQPIADQVADAPPPGRQTGTMPIDLSALSEIGASAAGSNATGSIVVGSGTNSVDLSGVVSNAGASLSGSMDAGLSIEDSDARKSGILSAVDFEDDMQSAIKASGVAQSGLAGEDIENVFDPLPDEDGGSDIVADESVEQSSFLDDDGSSSTSFDASVAGSAAVDDLDGDVGVVRDTAFSVWQICGLVCCALLMLTGGFVMFDLVRTIGSTEDLSRASPLLNTMADLFGWRR